MLIAPVPRTNLVLTVYVFVAHKQTVLFNDTIHNNIGFGKQNATKEEVELAAKNANAYDFIMGLEEGFDTMVGVGGGKISGGQKQRVAIARGKTVFFNRIESNRRRTVPVLHLFANFYFLYGICSTLE